MEPGIVIEQASAADQEWAAGLMASSEPWTTLGRGLEQCRAVCADPDHQTFVAREGDRAVGFVVLRRRGVISSPYIPSMAVTADARGRGVGSALLDFVEAQVASEAHDLFICASSFNPRARALYERHGFRIVGQLEDYIIPGASEVLMRKRLDSSG